MTVSRIKKTYATWISWNIVTNMGTDKELLAYTGGAHDYFWLLSPTSSHKAGAHAVVSSGIKMMNGSFYSGGAHPVLYQKKLLNKDYYEIEIQRKNLFMEGKTIIILFNTRHGNHF